MTLLLSVMPILVLIWLMAKRNATPAVVALPLSAGLAYAIQLLWFQHDLVELSAYSLTALIAMLTPISIVAGVFAFNRFQHTTGAAACFNQWLQQISPNPVAQLMLLAWAFAFLIEGASGFGAPLALATPMLVALGFKPSKAILTALAMNTVPVSFAAVGTTMWFGFSNLQLEQEQLLAIGRYTALLHCVAGLIIPLLALRFNCSWQQIRRNIGFIYLSILACLVPYLIIAQVSYEFPSLIGGLVGLVVTIVAAKFNLGLRATDAVLEPAKPIAATQLLRALLPMLMFIGILIVTRVQWFAIKDWLTNQQPWLEFSLAGLAQLQISQSLTISLTNLFGSAASGSYKLLFVPALIPFVLVILICAPLLGCSLRQLGQIFSASAKTIAQPMLAMSGALIMVTMLMYGEEQAPVQQIGNFLAQYSGKVWLLWAALMAAVGTFFSGSSTVSNLTFGAIQQSIAANVGLETNLILALQSVGSAMGVMISIHNIVVVSTILGIPRQEGSILKQILPLLLLYALVVALAATAIWWFYSTEGVM